MKTIIAFLSGLLFFVQHLTAQSLYKIGFDEKVRSSSLIVEGKIVSQVSFWNAARTMIFTSNSVEVSKIFKGDITDSIIEVITVGGSVGNSHIEASDLLSLEKEQVGLFFCIPNSLRLHSPKSKRPVYDVYSSVQGFLQYDLQNQTASAPLSQPVEISTTLYNELVKKTGRQYKIIKPFLSANKISQRENNTLAVGITSFSPATVNAGALLDAATNVLTINGSGFGTPSGAATVFFDDANDGTGNNSYGIAYNNPQIISWTDTEIRVRVPSRAGTGLIYVRDAAGTLGASSSELEVLYSVITASFNAGVTYIKESNLMDANGSGGYDIVYSDNAAGSGVDFNSSSAKETFQRALATWKEISGYNITEAGSTNLQSIADDDINVIMFDNANTGVGPLPAGTLAVCYSYNSMCGPDYANSFAQKTGFDIVVRNPGYSSGTTSFTTGPCPPNASDYTQQDLETVLLHELGHSLNLGHINDSYQGTTVGRLNPGKLMHYGVVNSTKRVTPDYSAKAAANYLLNPQGNTYGSCLYTSEMMPLAVISETKDECPSTFPSTAIAQNTTINFDLAHATSNRFVDPAYTQIRCDGAGASLTNNAYYAFKTSATGSLLLTVSDYTTTPAALTSCTQVYSGIPVTGIRLVLYQVSSCPTAGAYPAPVACVTITGNGTVSPIAGITANTDYLLLAEGIENTKASFNLNFGGSLLPLKITQFSGLVLSPYNEVNWETAEVENVIKMLVQKSNNGTSFETAFELNEPNTILQGNWKDFTPYSQTFYRLVIINSDGSKNYSEIINLKRQDQVVMTAYPNPALEYVTIQLNQSYKEGYNVVLYNGIGQKIKEKKITGEKTQLSTGSYLPGYYKLVLYHNNVKLTSLNLVIQ